jgi:hypothetical protein
MPRSTPLPLLLLLATVLGACGDANVARDAARPRAVPSSPSSDARAPRLPVMRLAPSRPVADTATGRVLQVRVLIDARMAGDSLIRVGALDPACGDSLTDTLVTRSGLAVVGAMVWVEGPTAVFAPVGPPERRATITVEGCQLRPRVQVAPPGSMLQLVMRDARAESLVVVSSSNTVPIDTIAFLTDGQLVPVRSRADSIGVVVVHTTRVPWARAYVVVTPPALGAITDVDGMARFTLDRTGRTAVFRAWHPALGIVSATVDPSTLPDGAVVTLTFRP